MYFPKGCIIKMEKIIYMKNKKNPTLTKNMPNVKWKSIPPVKGPDSQGISAPLKPTKYAYKPKNTLRNDK